jgi:hypothetical protein
MVRAWRSAVIHCGSDALVSWLNSTGNGAFGVYHGPKLCPVNRAERPRSDRLSRRQQFGNLGTAFPETDVDKADLETLIGDLMSGQYSNPVRVVAFNTAEQWSADVSQDVAHEIRRRADLAGDDVAPSIAEFVETHAGPARQLSLRLI